MLQRVLSGIGWNGPAQNCLKLVACRQVFLYVTREILAEYAAVIPETLAEEMPKINPQPKLAWIRNETSPGWLKRPRWASGAAAILLKMIFTSPQQLRTPPPAL